MAARLFYIFFFLEFCLDFFSLNFFLKKIKDEKDRGTQIKLILLLADGTEVLVKPMRWVRFFVTLMILFYRHSKANINLFYSRVPRDYITPPDHFYFVDFERHHAEIAAYHVDK